MEAFLVVLVAAAVLGVGVLVTIGAVLVARLDTAATGEDR